MKREDGYYWIKIATYGWMIAEWYNRFNCWGVSPLDGDFHDSDFDEIDENQIIRKENENTN
jgi:hypothetical protein